MTASNPSVEVEIYSVEALQLQPTSSNGLFSRCWNGVCRFFEAFMQAKHALTYWCIFVMTEFVLNVIVNEKGFWNLIAACIIALPMIIASYFRIKRALTFYRGLTILVLLTSLLFLLTTFGKFIFTRRSYKWLSEHIRNGAMIACGCAIQYYLLTDVVRSETCPTPQDPALTYAKMVTRDNEQTVILHLE